MYAGSFDPLTVGHEWMIARAAELFHEVVVAIGINPEKKYTFTLADRLEMLKQSTRRYRGVRVASFNHQFLINYARSVGAKYILRGIRSESDYEYERVMRNINGDLNAGIQTIFLMPPRHIAEVSSSMVKGLIGPKGWEQVVRDYVPVPVYRKLAEKFREPRAAKKVD